MEKVLRFLNMKLQNYLLIMFKSIRTSENNKKIISKFTHKWGLGNENVIARIAIGLSLQLEGTLSLDSLRDAKGKEYKKNCTFWRLP